MIEIERCPFCGETAIFDSRVEIVPVIDKNGAYIDGDTYYYEFCGCPACDIGFYISEDESAETTIKKWNRRVKT